MNFSDKIELSMTYAKKDRREVAKEFGFTPQGFYQRLKTGKFTAEELEAIASAIGCEVKIEFVFPDGKSF